MSTSFENYDTYFSIHDLDQIWNNTTFLKKIMDFLVF